MFGNPSSNEDASGMYTLQMILLFERLVLLCSAMRSILFKALILRVDDARNIVRKNYAMAYLRQHDVSLSAGGFSHSLLVAAAWKCYSRASSCWVHRSLSCAFFFSI